MPRPPIPQRDTCEDCGAPIDEANRARSSKRRCAPCQRDHLSANNRASYARHRDVYRARNRAWWAAHPDYNRVVYARRKRRKLAQSLAERQIGRAA